MAEYRYLHLDVFTEEPMAGNQLAVFPEPAGLDDGQMQRIANEMNFAETTFAWPAEDAACDVRVRIFTPQRELPMAGHPTVGTAFALAETGFLPGGREATVFELGVGPTRVELEWAGGRLASAWMFQKRPEFGDDRFDRPALAKALGVGAGDIDGSLPVVGGSAGVDFLYVPLVTREAVDRAWLDVAAAAALYDSIGHEHIAAYVFSLEDGGDGVTAYCRMFGAVLGVTEDPATGSAAGPLAAYLVRNGRAAMGEPLVLRQGVKMGRPGTIMAAVQKDGSVRVGGPAVVVGEGTIRV